MGKVLGEISVTFDDGTERKFKVRRKKYTESSRVLAMLRAAGTLKKTDDDRLIIEAGSLDVEKWAAYQIELIRMSVGDDDGKPNLKTEEIDDWGIQNIGAVCSAIDDFVGPAKTSIDHAGN